MSAPSYKFTDGDNTQETVPDGDYMLEVISVENSLVPASGNEMVTLGIKIHPSGKIIDDRLVLTEKAYWRIDTCLKSLGCTFKRGDDVVLDEALLLGRRGWGHVLLEDYTSKKTGKTSKVNNIGKWYTDKDKPARNMELAAKSKQNSAATQTDDPDFT